MMKFGKGYSVLFSTAICVFLLVGCGGGGGASGNDGSSKPPVSTAPPPSYTGRAQPATVSRNSALQLAQMVVSATSLFPLVDSLWIYIPSDAEDQTETIEGPGGGSAELSLVGNKITAKFRDFTASGLTLNGMLEQTVDTNAPQWWTGGYPSRVAGTMRFDRLELSGQGLDYLIHGNVVGKDYSKLTFNLVAQDRVAGESAKLENFVIEWRKLPSLLSFFPDLDAGYLSGTLYDSELGRIDVATSKPFHELGFDEQGKLYGTGNGIVDIAGSGVDLQLAVMNRRYAALALDEDANGSFETAVRLTWNQLLGQEPLASTAIANPPVANTGPDLEAVIGVPAFLHALFSHGQEGRFLTYQWRLEDAPAGGYDELAHGGDSAYFEFVPKRAGDYLVSLTVSDGEHSSRTTLKISAKQNDGDLDFYYPPAQSTTGELELNASEDKAEYTIDGRSVLDGEDESVWIRLIDGYPSPFVMDENSGSPVRTLYNPNVSAGMVQLAAEYDYTNLNIGLGRYESHSRAELGPNSTRAVVAEEFGSGYGGDILYHYTVDPYGNMDSYLEVRARDYSASPARLSNWGPKVAAGEAHLTLDDLNGDGWRDAVTLGTDAGVSEGDEGVYVSLQVQKDGNVHRQLDQPRVYPFHPDAQACNSADDFVAVSIGDFDGDDVKDLLALADCGRLPAKLTVWRGLGGGELAPPQLFELDLFNVAAADFADFNGDGREDLVIMHCGVEGCGSSQEPELWVYLNLSSGFSTSLVLADPEARFPKTVAGDFNGDGKADLIYSSRSQFSLVDGSMLFVQDDNGNFVRESEFPAAYVMGGNKFASADLSRNGHADLIFAGDGPLLRLAFNNGDGSYSMVDIEYSALEVEWTGRTSVADMNGDGEQDILLQHWSGFHTLFSGLHPYPVPVVEGDD